MKYTAHLTRGTYYSVQHEFKSPHKCGFFRPRTKQSLQRAEERPSNQNLPFNRSAHFQLHFACFSLGGPL
eukprot:378587-Amphidinium_carterae.1